MEYRTFCSSQARASLEGVFPPPRARRGGLFRVYPDRDAARRFSGAEMPIGVERSGCFPVVRIQSKGAEFFWRCAEEMRTPRFLWGVRCPTLTRLGNSDGQCGGRRIMRFRLKNDEFPALRRGDANAARRGHFFLTNIEVYSESFSVSGRDLAREGRSARDEAPALFWKVDRVLLIEGC